MIAGEAFSVGGIISFALVENWNAASHQVEHIGE